MTTVNLDPNTSPAQQLTALHSKINEILDKGIPQFLLPYANDKKPLYIYIEGYTPSFNDGEPCIHDSYAYGKDELIVDYDILVYSKDLFGDIDNNVLSRSRSWPTDTSFYEAIGAVEEALEFKYGTDYHVLITLKDGNVSYVKDDYECGY